MSPKRHNDSLRVGQPDNSAGKPSSHLPPKITTIPTVISAKPVFCKQTRVKLHSAFENGQKKKGNSGVGG